MQGVGILVGLFSVFLASVSQVLLKCSANKKYKFWWQEYINKYVITGYLLLLITSILGIISYKFISITLGLLIESTSYIYITFWGVKLFKENISKSKYFAIALIILGILIYALNY